MRCRQCSEVRGYPYKRSHLVALRPPRSRRAIRPRHGGRVSGEKGQGLMKFTTDRPFADPDKAARRLMDHARAVEPVQDGRI